MTLSTQEIIDSHKLWLINDPKGMRANLSGANLSGADLSGADLSGANLSGANLSGANLSGAYLSRADLSRADLSRTYLSRADLSRAYLSGANLSRANLSGANLPRADLSGANLSGANLSGANLSGANLPRADLSGANLSGAYLSGANLSGANLPAPTGVILANWGELPDDLTKLAMAYDASNHDNPELFCAWASGGSCPYGKSKFQRACNFQEKRELWDPTIKCPRGFDLMVALIREKCVDSDYHVKDFATAK